MAAKKKKGAGVPRPSHRERRVRALLSTVTSMRFLPAPRLVIFIAEGALPYAAPWEWIPGALRSVLGIELPVEVAAEIERILALSGLPTIALVDGMLEVHEGAQGAKPKGKA